MINLIRTVSLPSLQIVLRITFAICLLLSGFEKVRGKKNYVLLWTKQHYTLVVKTQNNDVSGTFLKIQSAALALTLVFFSNTNKGFVFVFFLKECTFKGSEQNFAISIQNSLNHLKKILLVPMRETNKKFSSYSLHYFKGHREVFLFLIFFPPSTCWQNGLCPRKVQSS